MAHQHSSTVCILGAGVSGIAMAHRIRKAFPASNLSIAVFERLPDLGGTWLVNTYPGAACDVASHLYSLSSCLNPGWSEGWALQSEIHAYLRSAAVQLGVMQDIRFQHSVTAAKWDTSTARWLVDVTTPDGPAVWSCQFLIAAPGPLCAPNPVFSTPGVQSFSGAVWHSAQWRHDVDLAGKRVVVVGTGASAAQIVPAIAPLVGHLTLIQRTPAWVLPRGNFRYSALAKWLFATFPLLMLAYRTLLFFLYDLRYFAFINPPWWLKGAVAVFARKFLKRSVADPALREALTPHYDLGCKRVVISDDFYPALCLPNVELVASPLVSFCPKGIRTGDGAERAADVVILATGFDVAASFPGVPFTGLDGASLTNRWASGSGPEAYRGVATHGFPNLFFLVGPNTGLGHNSIIAMIEPQTGYIAQCMGRVMTEGANASIVVKEEAERAFNAQLQRDLRSRVWAGCASWYNAQGVKNATMWPHTVCRYIYEMWAPVWRDFEIQRKAGV